MVTISDDKVIELIYRDMKIHKIHEYGGNFKCPECGCVVDRYAKFCHYCGQHFHVKETDDEDES